jgi:hypothetical protein
VGDEIRETFDKICDWYGRQLEKLWPQESASNRVEVARIRSAKPKTLEEVQMRALTLAHSLSLKGQMMMPTERLREEIHEILEPVEET